MGLLLTTSQAFAYTCNAALTPEKQDNRLLLMGLVNVCVNNIGWGYNPAPCLFVDRQTNDFVIMKAKDGESYFFYPQGRFAGSKA